MTTIRHKPRSRLGTVLEKQIVDSDLEINTEGESLKKALLLDDDQIFCKLFKKEVNNAASMLLEITSKVDIFLSLLRQNQYDVCIIDYDLYDTTGIQVLARMREFSDVPAVLISSSYASIPEVPEGMLFDDYLSKWVDTSVIVAHSLDVCRRQKEII